MKRELKVIHGTPEKVQQLLDGICNEYKSFAVVGMSATNESVTVIVEIFEEYQEIKEEA